MLERYFPCSCCEAHVAIGELAIYLRRGAIVITVGRALIKRHDVLGADREPNGLSGIGIDIGRWPRNLLLRDDGLRREVKQGDVARCPVGFAFAELRQQHVFVRGKPKKPRWELVAPPSRRSQPGWLQSWR